MHITVKHQYDEYRKALVMQEQDWDFPVPQEQTVNVEVTPVFNAAPPPELTGHDPDDYVSLRFGGASLNLNADDARAIGQALVEAADAIEYLDEEG